MIKNAHALVADFHHDYPNKSKPANFQPPKDWIPHEAVTETVTTGGEPVDAVIGSNAATGSANTQPTTRVTRSSARASIQSSTLCEGGLVPASSKSHSKEAGVTALTKASANPSSRFGTGHVALGEDTTRKARLLLKGNINATSEIGRAHV